MQYIRGWAAEQDALEEVAFENVGLSIRACQALAELLAKPGHLRQLHFRNNMSDDDGAVAIAQVRTGVTAARLHACGQSTLH